MPIIGFRGHIGFRGCNKQTHCGTEAKTKGLISLATVFISLIDYTPPYFIFHFVFFSIKVTLPNSTRIATLFFQSFNHNAKAKAAKHRATQNFLTKNKKFIWNFFYSVVQI